MIVIHSVLFQSELWEGAHVSSGLEYKSEFIFECVTTSVRDRTVQERDQNKTRQDRTYSEVSF